MQHAYPHTALCQQKRRDQKLNFKNHTKPKSHSFVIVTIVTNPSSEVIEISQSHTKEHSETVRTKIAVPHKWKNTHATKKRASFLQQFAQAREKLRATISQDDKGSPSLNQNPEVEADIEHKEVQGVPKDGGPVGEEQDEAQLSTDLPTIMYLEYKTLESFRSHTSPTKAPPQIVETDEEFQNLLDEEPLDELVSEVTMWKELTHKARKIQHPSNKVPSSILTSSYSILLRVAACHWIATSHTNTVTKAMGMLSYKIKNNVPVNLGKLIVARISEFGKRNYKQNDNGLRFSVLIFQMLVSQGFNKKDVEKEEPMEPLLQIDNKHFDGKHFNNMETVAHQATHGLQGVLKFLEHKLQQNKGALLLVDQQRITLEEEHWSLIWLQEHVALSAQAEGASSQGESTEEEKDNATDCSA
ncbi:unnamed protein product [Cuscuta campestris]|uniref:Uncharacterized protein n=1 Tax=Cuscuta campestris TaxID=132261 RepID=A0A484KZ78_9ASTE|nr:unnamed protein product [Cuscuta campestris]